jgi:putative peptidoglycan lipid II flippase
LVEPGAVLADRYVVEDLLAREGESETWRAHDKILSRSVVLQILPSSSPFARDLLAAAKRASRVTDTRILQVLDAVDDGEHSYVVREWASGQSLEVVLSEGPMAARRATWLMREVAAAMTNAHRIGIPHRRLAPDNVVITKSSGVKLIGLGTAAVLRGDDADADNPELEDTLDLGRLLYACLTARWPGGELAGLPVAPTEHGRLLRPRQVRAGVPRALDAVCDRILGQQSRYGEPIRTVAEVKENLDRILSEEGFVTTGVGMSVTTTPSAPQPQEPPPAVFYRDGAGPPTGEQPAVGNGRGSESSVGRTLGWAALAVLILGAMLLAYLVGQHDSSPDDPRNLPASPGSSTSQDAAPTGPLQIAAVHDFDPLPDGSGDENPDQVSLAIDNDATSAWTTKTYYDNPELGLQKDGVGLVVDLGDVHDVSAVEVSLQGSGTDLELRAAPSDVTGDEWPTDSADSYDVVDSIDGADSEATFTLNKPVSTRYLLVWLTSLPAVGPGDYRGGVSDIVVKGS